MKKFLIIVFILFLSESVAALEEKISIIYPLQNITILLQILIIQMPAEFHIQKRDGNRTPFQLKTL